MGDRIEHYDSVLVITNEATQFHFLEYIIGNHTFTVGIGFSPALHFQCRSNSTQWGGCLGGGYVDNTMIFSTGTGIDIVIKSMGTTYSMIIIYKCVA